ncbi:MAG TPA: nitroreductase/quinone reductase family protein [Candidatus Dormibacteraeota bacterium]|jgi:deazaflavin-dependent oxidoreductase (nitroreductase family)
MAAKTRMWGLRPFTMRLINPLTRLFAGRMPGFGLLTYRGRTTGRIYHLPINAFKRGEHYIFVLTYGSESEWVKNVLAAGGCEIRVRGRDVRLVAPELMANPAWDLIPWPARFIERMAGVTEFLRMRAA